MAFVRSVRHWHRRLSIFVGIQLALWTVSGIYFAWTDIDEIRGDDRRAAPVPVPFGSEWVAPTAVDFEGAGRVAPTALADVAVVAIDEGIFYRLVDADGNVALADVRTGAIRDPLTREEAIDLARASFLPEADVAEVTRVESSDVNAHHEYRGGSLPAWRVTFADDASTRVYVAAVDGAVTKHRNAQWRVFDFLWMLHTMDYRGRDDFNNPLLRVVSVLALVTVVSGFLLWAWTSRVVRRRG